MFLVIPAERIHSFIGCCVQLRFRPLNTRPFFSGLYPISSKASSLIGMMSSVLVFWVMVWTHFPPAANATISSQQRESMSPGSYTHLTTNMTTVIASVSSRATATRPVRTDMSSHTAPGSRMFTLKSSGNLLILYIIISVQVLANSMSIRLRCV